jgi:Flp pilus assembly protein TadG
MKIFHNWLAVFCSRRTERGGVMVEAALIFPVVVLLLFGIIQYGYILSAKICLRNASAVAARTAILDDRTDDEIVQSARDAVGIMLDSGSEFLSVALTTEIVDDVETRTVSLSYDLPLIVPFMVPGSSDGNLVITADATMR